jgi:hypothetical protein
MKKANRFEATLIRGTQGESALDDFFRVQGFEVKPVKRFFQERGIDRLFTRGRTTTTVEYKTDWRAAETGNFFIEVDLQVANGKSHKPGWAHTFLAQYLVFYVPQEGVVHWVGAGKFKEHVMWNWRDYVKRHCQARGYRTGGWPIPRNVIEDIALETWESAPKLKEARHGEVELQSKKA